MIKKWIDLIEESIEDKRNVDEILSKLDKKAKSLMPNYRAEVYQQMEEVKTNYNIRKINRKEEVREIALKMEEIILTKESVSIEDYDTIKLLELDLTDRELINLYNNNIDRPSIRERILKKNRDILKYTDVPRIPSINEQLKTIEHLETIIIDSIDNPISTIAISLSTNKDTILENYKLQLFDLGI